MVEEGDVGPDVHRAARIAASGDGDLILVSSATAALVTHGGTEPLRDLGEHRFKDLAAPERVFQLGDQEFPPLKSLYRTNLPAEISATAGDRRHAGTLWGAVEAENERAGVRHWLHGRVEPDRVLAHAEAEFEEGRRVGGELSLEDAIALALDADGD